MSSTPSSGPPYAPVIASVGGIPDVLPDVPVLAVFIALFIGGAVGHMSIYQLNRKKAHKFLLSALMFGFCMSRIAACVLRLVWATRQSDISVSIAANIFLNAGILIVYILNNVMVQRLLRSTWPHVGWNPVLRVVWKVVLWLVLPFIIMVIVCVPLTFYTLDANTLRICRDVLLVGLTYLFVVACIPLLVLPVVALRSPKDPFGKYGSTHTGKLLVLSATTVLAVIEAGFRTGVQWSPARPQTDPAWYHSKAAFYCFNFTIDILIIYTLLIARFDHHFWVPNQANGHGSYAAGAKEVQREETLAREKKAMEEQV